MFCFTVGYIFFRSVFFLRGIEVDIFTAFNHVEPLGQLYEPHGMHRGLVNIDQGQGFSARALVIFDAK